MIAETAIIVPTYNQKELTLKLIDLLKCQTYQDFDIIVIDNNSQDGTYDYLKKSNEILSCIILKKNGGSSGAQNYGAKMAYDLGYKYIIMTDNDAYPTSNNLLLKLISKLKNGADACLPLGEGGYELKAFHYFSVKREVLKKVGFPKEEFFLLYDDIEFYTRIHRAGFKITHLTRTDYSHPHKTDSFFKYFYLYYDLRNSIYACQFIKGLFWRETFGRLVRAASLLAYAVISKDEYLFDILMKAIDDASEKKSMGPSNLKMDKIVLLKDTKFSSSKITLYYPFKSYGILKESWKKFPLFCWYFTKLIPQIIKIILRDKETS